MISVRFGDVSTLYRPPGLDFRSRPKALCFIVGRYLFLSVSELPLNFISCTRNVYIIFRLKKNNTNGPIFGSPKSPKINDVIKSAQKRNTLENFFLKIDIIEPRARSTLAPVHNFSFRQLFPLRGKLPQRKIFYPYFLGNF